MLDPKELRVGNLVLHYGWRKTVTMIEPIVGTVTQITVNNFQIDHSWSGKKYRAEGIPLSNEWMTKMGFTTEVGYGYWNNPNFPTLRKLGYNCVAFEFHNLCQVVPHVHIIQNLFYILRGYELKIVES